MTARYESGRAADVSEITQIFNEQQTRSAIQTLPIETNHKDLKDLKEIFAACRGGKSACPFEVFEVFEVHFFFSAPSRLATPV